MVILVKSPLSPVSCFLTFIVTISGPVGAVQHSPVKLAVFTGYMGGIYTIFTESICSFSKSIHEHEKSNSIQQEKMLHLNLHEITYLRAGRGSSVSGSELAMMEG